MKKHFLVASLLLTSILNAEVHRNTGCGLGSMIIENQNTVAKQVLAATTNATSGNQTFGITTGTLNCNKPVVLVSNEKAEKFVADNMDALAIDIATGEGENLETLSTLLNIEDKATFNQKLKANFSKIYSSAEVTSADVLDRIAVIIG
ncbi:MAG: DUF3015 domain-containing protein [Epsilonproteobacteria bacterium]|nr:DUF3015 domain-containing protein [Campylobacterota bacterium]